MKISKFKKGDLGYIKIPENIKHWYFTDKEKIFKLCPENNGRICFIFLKKEETVRTIKVLCQGMILYTVFSPEEEKENLIKLT